ncbi:hypothetical protein DRF62_02365 [Chryseobacterium piscium]|uniref:Uncharacterized protein n=2 Tax=Chryseobacterium piscium TaxID=333702 RepID=A0A3D9BUA6_9FLAO|nr:hypothetical protein DRF62_02365 [Chryseobacterium piscium]
MKEEILKTSQFRLGGKHRFTYIKLVGSIIVILSGFVPFTDNIWSWIDPEFNKTLDARGVLLRSDVWIESLYVSILLTSLGRLLKAYPHTYFFPIYAATYSLVMYELMRFGFNIDPDWFHRLGFLIMLLPGLYIIYRLQEYVKNLKLQDEIQFRTIERISISKTKSDEESK